MCFAWYPTQEHHPQYHHVQGIRSRRTATAAARSSSSGQDVIFQSCFDEIRNLWNLLSMPDTSMPVCVFTHEMQHEQENTTSRKHCHQGTHMSTRCVQTNDLTKPASSYPWQWQDPVVRTLLLYSSRTQGISWRLALHRKKKKNRMNERTRTERKKERRINKQTNTHTTSIESSFQRHGDVGQNNKNATKSLHRHRPSDLGDTESGAKPLLVPWWIWNQKAFSMTWMNEWHGQHRRSTTCLRRIWWHEASHHEGVITGEEGLSSIA